MKGRKINRVIWVMILIISDNSAFAENIGEILFMEGLTQIEFRDEFGVYDSDVAKGVDLIIYNHSSDPTGERFDWYLVANNIHKIPVIFLTLRAWENSNENHFHLELPFEFDLLESTISHCVPMSD